MQRMGYGVAVVVATLAMLVGATAGQAARADKPGASTATTTPIQHLVVIFQENVSFDHYFATYPAADNPPGEPVFVAARDTPTVNGLNEPLNAPNNTNATQPFRLDRSQYRLGTPPVRPCGLLGRRGRTQPACRQLPEGPRLPGRPRRLLRSARRAGVPRLDDQPAREDAYWDSTAVVIAYDDSDGWYDHAMSPIVNPAGSGTSPSTRRPARC